MYPWVGIFIFHCLNFFQLWLFFLIKTRIYFYEQFVQVIYYQLKFGFQKDDKNADVAEKGAMALLDESWLSDDSFLHILCKVIYLDLVVINYA